MSSRYQCQLPVLSAYVSVPASVQANRRRNVFKRFDRDEKFDRTGSRFQLPDSQTHQCGLSKMNTLRTTPNQHPSQLLKSGSWPTNMMLAFSGVFLPFREAD